MRRTQVTWKFSVLMLALVMVLVGCGSNGTTEGGGAAPASPPTEGGAKASGNIVIGYQPLAAGLWPAIIMKEKRTYEAYLPSGVEVTFEPFNSGPAMNTAIIGGKAQFGYQGDMPALINVEQGILNDRYDGVLAAISASSTNFNRIMVHKDGGIESVKELTGKKIATVKNSTAHRFLLHVLEQEGIADSDVEIVNLDPAQSVTSLQSKAVDAITVWEPNGTLTEIQGFGQELANGDEYQPFLYLGILVGNESFMAENPEWAAAVIDAHRDAQTFLIEQKEESADILAAELNMDKGVVLRALEVLEFHSDFTEKEMEDMQASIDYLAEQGTLEASYPVNEYLYTSE